MKPTFKVLIVANNTPWASWPQKVSWLENFFQPIATLQIDIVHTTFGMPPFLDFAAVGTQYEQISGVMKEIEPAWYAKNVTPLAKGYDISMFVLPENQWPPLDCMRGITLLNTAKPIPCSIASDENEAVYQNGIELFPTAQHYMAHELSHALFELADFPFINDTTHYWDFAEKNLDGVLQDIKFTSMTPTGPTAENPDVLYPDWSTQKRAYHNVRVLCDLAGLSVDQKNLICACIYQESQFIPTAKGKINSNGTHDWGICQFNDGELKGVQLWIGGTAIFPSVDYVLANPEACVKEMIAMFKAGHINWWSSYSTGAYKQWLSANSPMWLLKS